jgi:hypothetical protein
MNIWKGEIHVVVKIIEMTLIKTCISNKKSDDLPTLKN